MNTTPRRVDRALIAVIVIILLIVVTAVIAVFASGSQARLDPASPEFAVQKYSAAILDSDRDAAMEMVTSDLRNNCEPSSDAGNYSVRITLVSTKINGDRATVKVTLNINYGGGAYGGSDVSTPDTFTLVKEGGNWRVSTAPWPLTACYNQGISEDQGE
ncbi:MAG: hypothetical protein KF742_08455 [Cryobacterium sp.]|nr:hypothetical protein [Cryobacterium sp.]MBX3089312.1 hypothetical protein [Cryobacterium sp.]MCO5294575.1 hypothetical protein [Homoserinimonas sp.]MCW5944440.1 hypothetical protein [Cryobacterium sp.]